LKAPLGAAWAWIVAPELFAQLFVAVYDQFAALDAGF
jgi:hypothetical protein